MTAIIIDGVQLHGTREVLIEATTSAVTTPLIEIRDLVNYTFTSSTLGTGEEILVEIYDFSLPTPNFGSLYVLDGARVRLSKDYEQLQNKCICYCDSFVKGATISNPVGFNHVVSVMGVHNGTLKTSSNFLKPKQVKTL